jgi:hypothetical protein
MLKDIILEQVCQSCHSVHRDKPITVKIGHFDVSPNGFLANINKIDQPAVFQLYQLIQ